MKGRTMNEKDFSPEGIKKLINQDIEEINHLSERDLISLWSFFKFLVTETSDKDDKLVFMTNKNSIIAKNREILKERFDITILFIEEAMAM